LHGVANLYVAFTLGRFCHVQIMDSCSSPHGKSKMKTPKREHINNCSLDTCEKLGELTVGLQQMRRRLPIDPK